MNMLYTIALLVLVLLILKELKAIFTKKNLINKRLMSMLVMYTVLTIVLVLEKIIEGANIRKSIYSSFIIQVSILIISYNELIFIRSYFTEKSKKKLFDLRINLILIGICILTMVFNYRGIKVEHNITNWLTIISVTFNWISVIVVTIKNCMKSEKKINVIILLTFLISTIKLIDNNMNMTYWDYYVLLAPHIILSIFLGINNIIYKDTLTNIYNRTLFVRKINEKLKKDKNFTIVSIDLDEFKLINDRYGHAEGDRALIIFAAALKKVCKHGMYAIRIGGDEFIILAKVLNEHAIKITMKELDNNISTINSTVGSLYNIKYSYGYDYYYNYDSFIELMEGIDKKMYKNKHMNKKGSKVN